MAEIKDIDVAGGGRGRYEVSDGRDQRKDSDECVRSEAGDGHDQRKDSDRCGQCEVNDGSDQRKDSDGCGRCEVNDGSGRCEAGDGRDRCEADNGIDKNGVLSEIGKCDVNGSNGGSSGARDCCMCSERHKERSPEEYRDLINRLSRIEGQVRGIKAMVERGAYCPDILIQASAVNSALNSFSKILLSNHIRTCVRNDIRDGSDEVVDEVVEELVTTLQKMMK